MPRLASRSQSTRADFSSLSAGLFTAGLGVVLALTGCSGDDPVPGAGSGGTSAGSSSTISGGAASGGSGGSNSVASGGAPSSSGGAPTASGGSPSQNSGGSNASAGASSGGSNAASCSAPVWPTATGEKAVPTTIEVSDSYDGGMMRHNGQGEDLGIDCSGADEQSSTQPLFELAEGATIKNVIFGKFAADGIHCAGNCTIENVWWEDLCDDAATFLGTSSSMRATVNGGGARNGADKTFQHNGAGTVVIQNFYVENVGKLYRSCGTCDPQHERHVEVSNVIARDVRVQLVAMNEDFNDTAKLSPFLCMHNVKAVCGIYSGNDHRINGPDAKTCLYAAADVKTF